MTDSPPERRRGGARRRDDQLVSPFDVAELRESAGRAAGAFERIASALEALTAERAKAPEPEPLKAEYLDGVNQWGTKADRPCPVCDSDIPITAAGIGECRQCGYRWDPRRPSGDT